MVDGQKTRISVAMTSYNGEAYLRRQIDSILEQLGDQDELIVSDDGSFDGTLSILEEYQNKDGRIRLFNGPRRGIKKNVEYALLQTRGQFIFLADQDDIWLPGKVERTLRAFQEEGAALVVHDAKVFLGEDVSQIWMESFFAFRNSGPGVVRNLVKNSYIGCCMAFRRELLQTVLPIPAQIEMHDQWIGILSDYFAGKSFFLSEPLLLYRRHGENNSAMEHYGIVKMLRNRVVLLGCFIRQILQNHHKRAGLFGKFKKMTVDK